MARYMDTYGNPHPQSLLNRQTLTPEILGRAITIDALCRCTMDSDSSELLTKHDVRFVQGCVKMFDDKGQAAYHNYFTFVDTVILPSKEIYRHSIYLIKYAVTAVIRYIDLMTVVENNARQYGPSSPDFEKYNAKEVYQSFGEQIKQHVNDIQRGIAQLRGFEVFLKEGGKIFKVKNLTVLGEKYWPEIEESLQEYEKRRQDFSYLYGPQRPEAESKELEKAFKDLLKPMTTNVKFPLSSIRSARIFVGKWPWTFDTREKFMEALSGELFLIFSYGINML